MIFISRLSQLRMLCGSVCTLLCACLPVLANPASDALVSGIATVAWQENTVPIAPALNLKALVAVELPAHSNLQLLLDRDSMTVTYPDGVVRYVAVLRGSNTQSALYQGIRCATNEVRTYARYDFTTQPPAWRDTHEDWRNIRTQRTPYARAIVRAGACDNLTAPSTSDELRRRFGAAYVPWSTR